MKTLLIFLISIALAFSVDDQAYLKGFYRHLGFTQDQVNANIDCFKTATANLDSFKETINSNSLAVSESAIIDWVQQFKIAFVHQCTLFEKDSKDYFALSTKTAVFSQALCNSLDTYNARIQQHIATWATNLGTNDQLAGKYHAYLYQILFGVANPETDPFAGFTVSISGRDVTFDATTSSDPDSTIATYEWDFGEPDSGSNTFSSSSNTATHTYSSQGGMFSVALKVTDNEGNTGTTTDVFRINGIPTAVFTSSVSSQTVSVDATSSVDLDGSITNYQWNFGEPSSASNTDSSTSSTSTHTYAAPGTYPVTLVVTDNEGDTGTITSNIKINALPTASFTSSVSGRTVTFDATGSTDSDGTISNYKWNFGEPSSQSNTASSASATASHTYSPAGGTFTVTLTITDSDGGVATQTDTVTVAANVLPTVSFTSSVSGRTVTFTPTASDSDGNIASYQWNFGEPSSPSNIVTTTTSSDASHTYSLAGGSFTVTLTVTDNDGETATSTNSVTVVANSNPTASFTSAISGRSVTFDASGSNDADGPIANYQWNFGESSSPSNTASSTSATASHTYSPVGGSFTVTLTVTDSDGVTAIKTEGITIVPNAAPTVSFTKSGAYRTVTFTPTAADSDGSVVKYEWNFGDSGSASNTVTTTTGTAQSHTYPAAGGSFTVTLIVTDNDGITTTTTEDITIAGNIAPTVSFTKSGAYRTVTFTPTAADSDGNVVQYEWDFGDSGSASNTATTTTGTAQSHTYPSAGGSFTVTLTVTDNDGKTTTATEDITIAPNAAPTVSFTKSGAYRTVTFTPTAADSDGNVVKYEWDFGDSDSASNTATTTTGTAQSHIYPPAGGQFTITLTVTDNDGATTTKTELITVAANTAPTFTALTKTGGTYRIVTITPTASDPDGSIVKYEWDFGDPGSTGNTVTVTTGTAQSHTYPPAGGAFTVTLIVTDNDGATNSRTLNLNIAANIDPTCSFTATAPAATATFTPTASDSDGSVVKYEWNFGDSGSSSNTATTTTGIAQSHTYPQAGGSFTVTLKVTDNEGATKTYTINNVVIKSTYPPTAVIATPQVDPNNLNIYTFDATSSYDPEGRPLTYSWNFGEYGFDNTPTSGTATSVKPTYTFSTPGQKTVSLMVTDETGLSHYASVTVTIAVTADFCRNRGKLSIRMTYSGSIDVDANLQAPNGAGLLYSSGPEASVGYGFGLYLSVPANDLQNAEHFCWFGRATPPSGTYNLCAYGYPKTPASPSISLTYQVYRSGSHVTTQTVTLTPDGQLTTCTSSALSFIGTFNY